MSDKRFEFYSDDLVIGGLDTVTGRTFNSFEIVDCLNEQQSTITELNEELEKSSAFIIEQRKENGELRKENEEYEKESEDMQTKINVLYNEAKKHMSSTEWENFNRRIIEREEELGIKWVRL